MRMKNSSCAATVPVLLTSGLDFDGPSPSSGWGWQRNRFAGILMSPFVKTAPGVGLGNQGRGRALIVQLPLAINENFSSISRAM